MTHRFRLFLGLFTALGAAASMAAHAAENAPLAWGKSAQAQEAAAAPSLPADQAAWRSSSQEGPVEIRFKKPAAVTLTDQSAAPLQEAVAEGEAMGVPAHGAKSPASPALSTAMKREPATTEEARIASTPEAFSEKIEAAPPSSGSASPARDSEDRRADEHIQLVARMFQEENAVDVPPVPGDEPLPRKTNGGDAPKANSTDDYDYAGEDYCGPYCAPPPPPLMWVGGVEATFLSPDINDDGVSFLFEEYAHHRSDWVTSQSTSIDSLYVAPRIWLGVQGCKWGANVRYWHMNASEGYFDPSIGKDGSWDAYDCGIPDLGFMSNSRFEAYTIDLEITRRFCLHDCWMQFSAGVRHAELEHSELLTGTALTDEAVFMGFAGADRYTRGTGLVLGLYGRKPLFPCSCVHWFYNVRWSALWGPTETGVETAAAVMGDDANAGSINGAYTCVDDNLFIGEIQLGLEWNYALRCMPANAFFRAAVEYQRWDGGQGYSESGSFAGLEIDNDFAAVAETFAASAAPEVDLIGFTIGTGLTW